MKISDRENSTHTHSQQKQHRSEFRGIESGENENRSQFIIYVQILFYCMSFVYFVIIRSFGICRHENRHHSTSRLRHSHDHAHLMRIQNCKHFVFRMVEKFAFLTTEFVHVQSQKIESQAAR